MKKKTTNDQVQVHISVCSVRLLVSQKLWLQMAEKLFIQTYNIFQFWYYMTLVLYPKILSPQTFFTVSGGSTAYLLASIPLLSAWNCTMMSVNFKSLSSSRWANTPARKNILLWPTRYRFGSNSKALIYSKTKNTQCIVFFGNHRLYMIKHWNNCNTANFEICIPPQGQLHIFG